MSASVKYTNKSSDEITQDIIRIIAKIKQMLAEDKSTQCKEVNIGLSVCGHGAHPFGAAALSTDYIDFAIQVGKESWNGYGSRDIDKIYNTLKSQLEELKKTDKRYATISFESEEIYPYCGAKSVRFSNVIPTIKMLAEPCKEFEKLNKILLKYTNKTISPLKWYRVDLFGKRGTYDESGTPTYNCFDTRYCQQIIDYIKKHKSSKDKLTFSITTNDDIDTEYSIKYETECYGRRYMSVVVDITTPTGRNKAHFAF